MDARNANTLSVSVIIPTYNRKGSLLSTLDSLGHQTYPRDRYEVIVVDDGSIDGTGCLDWSGFPFRVRYYRQENAGATNARNTGASISSAEILVFVDDDMAATPGMLEHLISDILVFEKVIVLGTWIPVLDEIASPFASLYSSGRIFPRNAGNFDAEPIVSHRPRVDHKGCFVHFTRCTTGVLCVRRQDFQALNMFQDPTGGWPNWDDLDFGYRAHLQGFRLWLSRRAIAYHHDNSIKSLDPRCDRQERASRSAVRFFARYPELVQNFPSFHDKGPVAFPMDSPALIMRKILRYLMSSPPSVAAMKRLTHVLEKHRPSSFLLILLYRWILSAYMFKGYRRGLLELAEAKK